MSIIFFLLLNFSLLTKHELISSWVNVFDLNSVSKISLLGGTFLISNIFLSYIFFFLEIIPYEHFYKINVGLLILGMFILGFIDDKFKIKPSVRLILTFFLIFFFLQDESYLIRKFNFSFTNSNLFTIESSSLSILFTIFCIMSFVNALNFFDGINLQVILYTMGCIIYLFFIEYSYFLLIILVTLTFFSYLNYQNKSFLGDSGTYILAIVISLSVINFHNRNLIFADQIILLFLLPGFEIVRLFIERIYKKKSPLSGDNEHIHHLMKKKVKSFSAFVVVIFSFVPIGLYTMNLSISFIFVFMFSMYFIVIFFLKKNENK